VDAFVSYFDSSRLRRVALILSLALVGGSLPAAPAAAAPVGLHLAGLFGLGSKDQPDQPKKKKKKRKGKGEVTAPAPAPKPDMATEIKTGLAAYRASWGSLPQTKVPAGATLKPGSTGKRVTALRERLGLSPGTEYDAAVAQRLHAYRMAHGLGDSELADAATVTSLNRGADYYEGLIAMNLDRLADAPRVPRYILVDAASARLWLYQDGHPVDTMKVVVGTPTTQTPAMETAIRWVEFNPYWNVPPDLIRKRIAPRYLKQGKSYFEGSGYEVLSSWKENAKVVSPSTVNWSAVARGKANVRVRQMPGNDNAMGAVKFTMLNQYGVYLHDTPNKELFAEEERWRSNGCVRVEDAERLNRWIFNGAVPQSDEHGRVVTLDSAVPVYITYLTASPDGGGGIVFRPDRYRRDTKDLARFAKKKESIETAARENIPGL
jgi:murein L,D-transpeptidase YcbB/YkuD